MTAVDLTGGVPVTDESAGEPRGRWRRPAAYVVAPAVALAVTALTAGSLLVAASFSDTAGSEQSSFSSGTVKISSKTSGNTSLSLTGMVAGDRLTSPVTVTNDGSLSIRYSLASTTTENVLAGQLLMTVKSGVGACTDAGFGAAGTVLYGPARIGSTQGVPVLGGAAADALGGPRTVAAGAGEVLCVQVQLPVNADNSVAGRTTTATFTFTAEQAG